MLIIMVGATFYMSAALPSLEDRFMALPYHAFILGTQHSGANAQALAAATALVLVAVTMLLSGGAIIARYYLRKRHL